MLKESVKKKKVTRRAGSQILFHQSNDSAKEHHDAPLWISRTKKFRTPGCRKIPHDMGGVLP